MAAETTDTPFTAAERQAIRRLLAKSNGADITRNPMAVALVVAFLALVGWIALETQANREAIHENGVAIAVVRTDIVTLKDGQEKLEARLVGLEASLARLEASQIEMAHKIDRLLALQSR